MFGTLTVMLVLLPPVNSRAQSPVSLVIQDSRGAALADAQVSDDAGHLLAHSDAEGAAHFDFSSPCRVHISVPGFAPQLLALTDDANQFLLHGYFRIDAYAAHEFGSRFEVYAAGENLADRIIEVSKTPTTTLADGRTGRIGVRVRQGETGK